MSLPATQPVWVVDTFCDGRHLGNPAAVILLDAFDPAPVLASTAACLALPTTAFVVARGADRYSIRWFTPEQELNLCGHATIAAASVLHGQSGSGRQLQFDTGFGPLVGVLRGDGNVALSLPAIDIVAGPRPAALERALGAEIIDCGHSVDDLVIELASESAVAMLAPDFRALKAIPCRGHVVTAPSAASGVDFVSRSFFPALGVDEDQVCVSAHCKLAPFWGRRLGKRSMTAIQLSQRGGRLGLQLDGDCVHVAGSARVRRETTLAAEAALAAGGLYRP